MGDGDDDGDHGGDGDECGDGHESGDGDESGDGECGDGHESGVAPSKSMNAPVGIIGAGIVGIACALHLQRLGRRVIVIDRAGPAAGASQGNAGVLACCAMVPVPTPGVARHAPRMLFDRDGPLFLRWPYLPRLLPWLMPYTANAQRARVQRIAAALAPLLADSVSQHRALAGDGPAARRIRDSDYLFVYPNRAAFAAEQFAWDLRAAAGFAWEVIEGEAVREVEPALGAAHRFAVRLGGHACIASPGDYVAELAGEVTRGGGELLRAEVADIRPRGDGGDGDGVAILTRGGPAGGIEVAAAVIATGAWSGPLGMRFGANVPLESERGYHLHFRAATGAPRGPVMFAQRKAVATPMDGDLRLAGLVEFAGLRAPRRAAPLAMLRRAAQALLPNLRAASCDEWLGHRPATTDSLPLLGPSPRDARVFFACGHQHIGLTAAAKSGRLVARMICGRAPGLDMSPYRPDRGPIVQAAGATN
ncbi:MAG: FAD-binding oxidoreductase [Gammaproteobacteria bacterium]|nr:FAD-binding oxidoreductase [Gammaproteobacteria bacterium]